MHKKPILIEMILIVAALFLGWRLYYEVGRDMDMSYRHEPSRQEKPADRKRAAGPTVQKKLPELSSYEVIAVKNLFNSRRMERYEAKKKAVVKEKTEAVAPQKPEKKGPGPFFGRPGAKKREMLVLEGVLIFNDRRVAFVRNLARPRDGVKRLTTGDTIDGYTVDSIGDDEVVLKGDEGEEKVLALFDASMPKRRRHIKTGAGSVFKPAPFTSRPTTPEGVAKKPLPRKPGGTMERKDER